MKVNDCIKENAAAKHYEIYLGNPFDIHTDTIRFLLSDFSDDYERFGIKKGDILECEIEPHQVNMMQTDEYNATVYANCDEYESDENMPTMVIILTDDNLETMRTYFVETVIEIASSGFNQYQVGEYNGDEWKDLSELKSAMLESAEEQNREIFILGEDELPEEVEDIRGFITSEPEVVFATVNRVDRAVQYGGIDRFIRR